MPDSSAAVVVTNEPAHAFAEVARFAVDAVPSEHSRRAYARALTDFLAWHASQGGPGLTKATVNRYRAELQGRGLAPSTINQRLSAIRKLAAEAADNGLLEQAIANGVQQAKGVKTAGVRSGNWLTREQAQTLLLGPEVASLKGKRDRAILAVMLGAGLRRAEVAALDFGHIQQREGRWVIADLVGKGNRVRTVPVPSWAKDSVDSWAQGAGIGEGRVFRAIRKGGALEGASMTPQAVHDLVREYAERLGLKVAAHDLRRTYAKLAHKGGSGLDQIQLSLGHASIQTTERYLGVEQSLTDAPCDRLGLSLR